jgi:hypothetical protein
MYIRNILKIINRCLSLQIILIATIHIFDLLNEMLNIEEIKTDNDLILTQSTSNPQLCE